MLSSDMTTIGVLSLQGDVEEHSRCFSQLGCSVKKIGSIKDIMHVDGIILPGGESTAMAIIAERTGMFSALREYIDQGKPIWGTCAGVVLLANSALNQAVGGQNLIGGLDVEVSRNYFGSQIHSCEAELVLNPSVARDLFPESEELTPVKSTFIRAPAITKVGQRAKIIATLPTSSVHGDESEIIVAALQDNILATTFHPELSNDIRWHKAFLSMVHRSKEEK